MDETTFYTATAVAGWRTVVECQPQRHPHAYKVCVYLLGGHTATAFAHDPAQARACALEAAAALGQALGRPHDLGARVAHVRVTPGARRGPCCLWITEGPFDASLRPHAMANDMTHLCRVLHGGVG